MTGPLISKSQVSTIPTKDKHTFLPLFHHHISIHIICLNAFQTIEKKRKSQAQESLPEKSRENKCEETNKRCYYHYDYHEDGKGIAINGDLFVHYLTLASCDRRAADQASHQMSSLILR